MIVDATSSADITLTITNNFFKSAQGDLIQTAANNSSTIDLTFTGNALSNSNTSIDAGGGGASFFSVGSSTFTYDIINNTFRDAKGIALNVSKGTGSGTTSGTIADNTIGVTGMSLSGSSEASGIRVAGNGTGTHTTLIDNNDILRYFESGLQISANDGSSTLNATVINNTIAEPGAFVAEGIKVVSGSTGTDSNTVCLDLGGGTLENSFVGSGPTDYNSLQFGTATISLPGYGGPFQNVGAITSFIQGRNTGSPSVSAFFFGSGGYANTPGPGDPCPTP